MCASGKHSAENLTCQTNPGIQSNVFGYTACYLVTGLPGGSDDVTDLASRLREQPDLVRTLGSSSKKGDADGDRGLTYETEKLWEVLTPSLAKTSRWSCNSCGLLDQRSDSASLLVQVAWASQSAVLDRDQVESILVQAREPLVELLALTLSAADGSAFHMGNLTVVRYPYCQIEKAPVPSSRFTPRLPPPVSREQIIAPAPCIESESAQNQTRCAIDIEPDVKFPESVYTQRGYVKNYVNLVEYLPVNSLLACQFVEVSKDDYTFTLETWTVRLNHCDTDVSAEDVTISPTDGTMLVCLKDYACWKPFISSQTEEDIHDTILRWMSLVCNLLSMLCCFLTFMTYLFLPKLQSSAGKNNMVLAFMVFFAQGFVQFGSSQKDRSEVCVTMGILTHFFWLAAVTAMSTATFHMFYALSFPLRFQQYHGRDAVLLRVYIGLILLAPSLFIGSTVVYGEAVEGNSGYASGSTCFVNAGLPRILFFGVPVLVLVLVNVGMYVFTVSRLHGTPNIGETMVQRNNAVLYSKLSVATGASWIFGFLYDWTELIAFAYAYMLTAPLLGLFLFLAFVMNKRVLDMARETAPECCAKLMPGRGEKSASNTPGSSLKKTKSTSAT